MGRRMPFKNLPKLQVLRLKKLKVATERERARQSMVQTTKRRLRPRASTRNG
jgi:hypothetical protein